MAIILPTQKHIPKLGMPENLGLLISGAPKIGKTSLAAEFPRSIILECEPRRADHIECNKIDISSLAELREAFMLVRESKEYDTIVFDSLDKITEWYEAEICDSLHIPNIMQSPKGERNGAQWGEYKLKICSFVAGVLSVNKNIIFLSHTRDAKMDENGNVISLQSIALYGQTASAILAMVPNIGYMFAKTLPGGKTTRYLSFEPGGFIIGGCSCPELAGKVLEMKKGHMYEVFSACFVPEKIEEKKKGGK